VSERTNLSRRSGPTVGLVHKPHPAIHLLGYLVALKGKRGTNLPRHEADSFDYGRLDDFFAGENAPCHSVRTFRMGVRPQITVSVEDIVCDVAIAFDMHDQPRKQVGLDEKFKVRL